MKRAAFTLALSLLAALPASAQEFDFGLIGAPELEKPAGPARAMVYLISDADGYGSDEEYLAAELVGEGAIVVGIDLPGYLGRLEAAPGDCVYLVSDIERVSQELQRASGSNAYARPIVAGRGAGGALALAIAAQSPADTIGDTFAVDPAAGITLAKPLCTPAPRESVDGLTRYGLTAGALPNPVEVVFSGNADATGRAGVEGLVAQGFAITVTETGDAADAFATGLVGRVDGADPVGDETADLPIVELEATPVSDTMAIVYSGDGGWRDLDMQIGDIFQTRGVPTIGVDSLRYFWSEKSPETVAADLGQLIDTYRERWGVKNVLLVGYSFGADALPAAYNLLSAETKSAIAQVTLLAPATTGSFEISVSGWLGMGGADNETLPEIRRIDPRLLQCVYGADDAEESACPRLDAARVEVIETTGGHHFDGNYERLAGQILDGLSRRLAPAQ